LGGALVSLLGQKLMSRAPAKEPHEVFALNLRDERHRKAWSQEQLGAACNLHPTEISRLERAVREPRLSTIVRLARALKVSPAELLKGVK
jgi:transcriptional regulator with XRE-family HTH domain